MVVNVPDEWAVLFEGFERALQLATQQFRGAQGISRMGMGTLFRTVCGGPAWQNPAFLVWAGSKGCGKFEDFYRLM